MMRAYPLLPSLVSGEIVTLCVQPDRMFRVAFFKQARSRWLERCPDPQVSQTNQVEQLSSSTGVFQSAATQSNEICYQDWNWPSISFQTNATDWPTGCYFAVPYEVDQEGNPIDDIGERVTNGTPLFSYMNTNMALIVVSPATPQARIAYIVPIATYHAYNFTGGGCFYGYSNRPFSGLYTTVTLRRPGGGVGGDCMEPPDPYDAESPRQSFAHLDAKMIVWLIENGFEVDFYSDQDLHNENIMLTDDGQIAYQLMLASGHYEYWSETMRAHVRTAQDAGVNIALFSGNTCYRPINFTAQNPINTGRQNPINFNNHDPNSQVVINRLLPHWRDVNNEASLIGVSFKNGGEWSGSWAEDGWTQLERTNTGYTVLRADHWIFEGTGLSQYDTFGNGSGDFLVGYECDGIVLGVTPEDTIELGSSGWLRGNWNWGTGNSASMVVIGDSESYPKRGVLFNGSTTDWPRVLANSRAASHNIVSQISYNVVSTLSHAATS